MIVQIYHDKAALKKREADTKIFYYLSTADLEESNILIRVYSTAGEYRKPLCIGSVFYRNKDTLFKNAKHGAKVVIAKACGYNLDNMRKDIHLHLIR